MENVSKAVIMAGSVLIAVGVISLALYFYGVMRGYISTTEKLYSVSQITSFNSFYESYSQAPGGITGADMMNILNKALDDNIRSGQLVELDPSEYLTTHTLRLGYDIEGRVNSVIIN